MTLNNVSLYYKHTLKIQIFFLNFDLKNEYLFFKNQFSLYYNEILNLFLNSFFQNKNLVFFNFKNFIFFKFIHRI